MYISIYIYVYIYVCIYMYIYIYSIHIPFIFHDIPIAPVWLLINPMIFHTVFIPLNPARTCHCAPGLSLRAGSATGCHGSGFLAATSTL